MAGLAIAEAKRQKNIRLELIILLELYKGVELTDREREILNKHSLQFDYKTDLKRCIYQVVYEISNKTMIKIEKIKDDKTYFFDKYTMSSYREYLKKLQQYNNSLLHAMCFNHQLILINPINNKEMFPVMDFDSDCLVEKKNFFTRKRTLN